MVLATNRSGTQNQVGHNPNRFLRKRLLPRIWQGLLYSTGPPACNDFIGMRGTITGGYRSKRQNKTAAPSLRPAAHMASFRTGWWAHAWIGAKTTQAVHGF